MKLSDIKMVHVSAWAETLWHFRMPLLRRVKEVTEELVIYCPERQYCGTLKDVCGKRGHVERLIDEGFKVKVGPIGNKPGIGVIYQIWVLYRYLKAQKFDVMMTHQPMGSLVGIIAGYLAGVPVRIYATGGLRYVPGNKSVMNTLYGYVESGLIRMADSIFLVNKEDMEYLSSLPRAKGKAYYAGPRAGCGIDTERFNSNNRIASRSGARKELGVEDDTFVVGYVGRCVWEKGLKELIDAAHEIKLRKLEKRIKYVLVGVGSDLGQIKDYVEHKGLYKSFKFAGYSYNVDYLMSAFDMFVLPSHREGMPISLLEAMAMGIPSIATNIRGSRELIRDGENGLLVDPGSSNGIVEAILNLTDNPEAARIYAERAEKYVRHTHSSVVLLERALCEITNLVGRI